MDAAPKATFLVLVEDVIVADDVAELLAVAAPGVAVSAPHAVVGAPPDVHDLEFDVLLTSWPIAALRRSGIAEAARRSGARIVVLDGGGDHALERSEGWVFVPSPFSEGALLDALLPARASGG
ncbi:hypothetical protein BCF33_1769 [Hasllibacter halocynthiae]|uniref:Response regulatory domain-containing protein n=1 Tax=Hasllibacter halocynthiae TaxID=595589 RepID=A0A2T0X1S7_9RHOB|nr:hypothetical protein [Hasllibacter halocynthiae]PRY92906.1 hypothetical protein BCF33_1769 [Hasllibacter halocynthiae]